MKRRPRNAPPSPQPLLRLTIESLDSEGRGVARNDGKVIFVEGALPGEIVIARVFRGGNSFDQASTVEVLHASAGRREPRCPHFSVCGGCATQHADARTQMAGKQRWLEDSLQRIGRVQAETLLPIIYGEEWGYRHRARMAARYVAQRGGALVGFHERKSSHIADMRQCENLPPRISRLIVPLRQLVGTLDMRERMPQVEIALGEAVDVLIVRNLDPVTDADSARLRAFAEREGVWLWLQPKGPATAAPLHPLSMPELDYTLPEFGIRIAFQPTDFTQVNHAVNRILVRRAVRMLDPQPGERVADLFCGLGNFSLPIAASGAHVLGLEGAQVLVERARLNARANGLEERAKFETANLFEVDAARLEAWEPFDKMLIDPPRDGAAELIKALPDAWPRRIVYVSCDQATLARDAGTLVHAKGFRLVAAGVVNMFPHTAHVESIALFERA
ncbi:MAG: 23S rRNA (uracil(1939)-C(5))-methyltransferase RlmD [Betaproteobacteria bacterium]|nr:23S rRNA (uracil(1939)-C(5))-methyltransferase RlmD [Betaproteobacteria bacterium]